MRDFEAPSDKLDVFIKPATLTLNVYVEKESRMIIRASGNG